MYLTLDLNYQLLMMVFDTRMIRISQMDILWRMERNQLRQMIYLSIMVIDGTTIMLKQILKKFLKI